MKTLLPTWTAGAVLLLRLAAATPGPADERFPFVIPGDDAAPSATDFSGLSPRPAGADGFVRIHDGHFHTDAGRLRIWGVNTCFGANFPEPADAEKVAAHLAKLGLNGVRMHHHDTAPPPRGVLARPEAGRRALDPGQLDRQDYFLDQLHRRGLYANLNLHVGREFTQAEGFPRDDLPYAVRYDKYLLYFEPRMREGFKAFCRDYLTHTNRYRKLRRVDDPGIAMVEISNENSFSKLGSGIAAGLPEPYRGEFKRQWNVWLRGRYASTAALTNAWSRGREPLGAVVLPPAAWTDSLEGWRSQATAEAPMQVQPNQPGPKTGMASIRLHFPTPAGLVGQRELQWRDLSLEPGRAFTLSFWLKAAAPRPVYVDLSRQGPGDWNAVGLKETLQAETQWRRVALVFRTADALPPQVRVCFKFGGSDADLWLAQVCLQRGAEPGVLPDGQSMEAGTVEIPASGWCEAAHADARRFMVDTEVGFLREIVGFLKRDLGVRVPITGSQITYHGARIVADTCDYADIHAYWEHPRFPRRPWDPVDWTLANTPMEAAPDRDRLLACAPWRLVDRPFTISEWNIPDPHDYAASVVPFALLVASLQDWDAVFFFQYHSSGEAWYADQVQRFFSFNGQPVKLALLAACAPAFRRGDLAPLAGRAVGTPDALLPATLGLGRRLGIDPQGASRPTPAPEDPKRLASPDGRVVWDATDPARASVRVTAPALRAAWGLMGGQSVDLGGARFTVARVERDYAALVLVSLDGRPVETAQRLLLAAVGAAANDGMVWNEARNSVGNQWGRGPARVNGIEAEVRLPRRVAAVRALDGRGLPRAAVPVGPVEGGCAFTIGPSFRTLWYEIVADSSSAASP